MSRPIVLKSVIPSSTLKSKNFIGPTRWGIMGAGKVSHDWAVGLATLPREEHKLVAVSSRQLESAKDFAKEHNVSKAFGSYEELVKDPEIEVVYISTTHAEHLQLGKLALDHGKHVLCEKPLCMDLKETLELVNYARQKKLFLMEGIWSRFMPAYLKMRELIDHGRIGEVKQVIAGMGLVFPEESWNSAREIGGGTVVDMGTYTSNFATFVYKGLKPEKIVALGTLNASGTEDSSSTTMIFSGGKTATLMTHSQVNLPCDAFAIGTKGTLKLEFPFWAPEKLKTPDGILEFPVPKTEKESYFWSSTALSYQCKEVRHCILNGLTESPLLTLDETLLLTEIRESIREQIGVAHPTD